jgi:amino acid transporter
VSEGRLGRGLAALLMGFIVSCASDGGHRVDTPRSREQPVTFSLVTVGGSRVDSAALRGRATVMFLFTSYDVTSQMVAGRLEELRRTRRPRINVLGVALEPPRNLPLVEAFAESLGLGYPVAMAAYGWLEGGGPFGAARVVPSILVLDASGRPVWRGAGAVSLESLQQALAKASSQRDAPGPQEVFDQ